MVLTHDAAIWYRGIKTEIHSWQQAIDLLLSTYGDRRPPHRIYRELFEMQQVQQNTDTFVAKCRALLSKIPAGDITEKAQVDMVYGLLDSRIRRHLRREEFSDFSNMLRLARSIEIELDTHTPRSAQLTKSASAGARGSSAPMQPPRRSTASATPSGATASSTTSEPGGGPTRRSSDNNNSASTHSYQSVAKSKYCVYCKQKGHVRDECGKLSKSDNKDSLYCYGCGEKGVVRSQCHKCSNLSFSSVYVKHNLVRNHYNSKLTTSSHSPTYDDVYCNINNHYPSAFYQSQCKQTHDVYSPATLDISFNTSSDNNLSSKVKNTFVNSCESEYTACQFSDYHSSSVNKSNEFNLCKLSNKVDAPILKNYHCNSMSVNNNNHICESLTVYDNDYVGNSVSCIDSNPDCDTGDMINISSIKGNDCNLPYRVNAPVINHNNGYLTDRVNVPNINYKNCYSTDRVKVPVMHSYCHSPSRVKSPVVVPTHKLCSSDFDQFNMPIKVSDCADMPATTAVSLATVAPAVYLSASDVLSTQQRPVLSIQVMGIRGMALIDTAARCSIAGHSLYKIFKQKGLTFASKQVNMKLADGVLHTREVLMAGVDVIISVDKGVHVDFVIFPDADNNDTLLGMDFLNAAGMVIDFYASSWHFSGCTQTYPLEFEDESIPQGNPISLSSFSLRADEGLMLNGDQRQQLLDLLQKHEDVFRLGGEATAFAEHHIDTGDHAPIAVPPYRLTPAKKAVMEAEINKMLTDGIIEECESAWAAPALLVPKKDGTYRFCVDYRRLNAVTKSDSYPLPVIEDLLHSTKREGYMSTIDLRSGYWQVSVSPTDRDKTAFVSPFGTYRFIRMPLGLKNAPATFQRLMDRFRSGSILKDVTLLVYLDDLLVLSEGPFQKHLEDLEAVFNRLRVFGLRANRDKCHFVCSQVKYLGHLITPNGIKPDEDKVQAIQQMNEPTNLKHLRSFLQTCSWFRKFVPGFSEIAQHDLRAILDKETYVPQVTPYLSRFVDSLKDIRDRVERRQDLRKEYADSSRRPAPTFQVGDQVLLTTHSLSNAPKGLTRKFMPQRDGPYAIQRVPRRLRGRPRKVKARS
ncbi:uncharacterized protein LOC113506895 [Trichoplusia ni]|uniref:Uncharacterized protein LOC113506895 n=1 Tax=Trichoplusia ni TaxID=7111 RepID=A0A7E5WZ59_TRINI|nr:uncharacterized protein LOC113506895 [Trichoplusia ni]